HYQSISRTSPGSSAKTTTFTRDGAHRITGITHPNGIQVTYGYDAIGRVTRISTSDGFVQERLYGSNGKLTEIRDADGETVVRYDHDVLGRLKKTTYPNGAVTEHTYIDGNRSSSVVHFDDTGAEHLRVDYQHDTAGRIVKRTINGQEDSFTHDATGRIISADFNGAGNFTISYDAMGNRTKVSRNGIDESYSVDSLNRYTSIGGEALQWDEDGNLTGKIIEGVEWTFDYNAENQLISASSEDDTITYEYDGLGVKIARVHNGERTEFVPDYLNNNFLIGSYTNTTLEAGYFHGYGLAGRQSSDGARQFYRTDRDGNVLELLGEDGDVLNAYRWGLSGEALERNETVGQPFGFGGRFGLREEPTGLLHVGIRYLSPAMGRFTSRDPSFLPMENLYTYADNNAIGQVDVTGRDSYVSDQQLLSITNDFSTASGWAWDTLSAGADNYAKFLRNNYKLESYLSSVVKNGKPFADTQLKSFTKAVSQADKLARWGQVMDGATAFYEFGSAVAGEDGFYNRIIQGHPMGNVDAVHASGKLGGKILLTALGVPFGGKIVDGADHWSKEYFKYYFINEYGVFVDDNEVFGEAYWRLKREGRFPVGASHDPNEKESSGVGENLAVLPRDYIDYTVYFENLPEASLPAQEVVVTDMLSEKLDWSTLELKEIAFNDEVLAVPGGFSEITMMGTVETDENPVLVDISLNEDTGELLAVLRSFNPLNLEFPDDPAAGFLPPNDESGRGEGHIRFRIRTRADLSNGDLIENKASIVFDENDPIVTNTVVNRIDSEPPSSRVEEPSFETATLFDVVWSGDDAGGAGVAGYDVYVSVDGGPFIPWLEDTLETTAVYSGELDKRYAFYSVAKDGLGHEESKEPQAEAVYQPGVETLLFEDWLALHFEESDLGNPAREESLWGYAADPDADGMANAFEYLFGGDPLLDDASDLMKLISSSDATRMMVRMAPGRRGMSLQAEQSGDLISWGPYSGVFRMESRDGANWISLPLSEDPAVFIRLMAE
ncbi:MAG TPA: RHS repeat-associated core domain-containing protein, partial [Oceanipulchritudo sp.]|nr:RHS repeat-associated core domain-containing protein [Oceanipulchritudo sp.]